MMRKISEDVEVTEEVSSSEINVSPDETPITHCILHNSVKLLVDTLNDEENELLVPPLLNERNATGKSPLELCAILGRTDIMRELLSKGADVNLANCEGYTPAHYASAWGQVAVLKILTEYGADLTINNIRNESPKDIAQRYGKVECIDFIDWAFAKESLLARIKAIQDVLIEPEKKPSREEKNLIINSCKEKLAWIENSPTATTQEFISQQVVLDTALSAVLSKITTSRK
ncbi:ankyrin repeat domain-containing protein 45 [Octopus bimaculoides]|uniref:Uncharacterized protein n=1 Tax=Octopus bimaculoides TaxID=37653 RepID=A0A0L8HGN3_OCTBM|nr:ankyrin repeat domain-containing protein 45 [Octopus bimaculoides]|eukprot:XP_014772535.1 PREDICTED: ankyrin repeat domain-containing protein 45-like [Octopus bimaculoides]